MGKHINLEHKNRTIPLKGNTQCPYCLKTYMNLEPLLIHSKLKQTNAKWKPCICPLQPTYISQQNMENTIQCTSQPAKIHKTNKTKTPTTKHKLRRNK